MVYIMVIITLETETTYNVRSQSYMADAINWPALMKNMRIDAQYSIRVIDKRKGENNG